MSERRLIALLVLSISVLVCAKHAQAANLSISCSWPTTRVDGTPFAASDAGMTTLYEITSTGNVKIADFNPVKCGGAFTASPGTHRYVMTVTDKLGSESALSSEKSIAIPTPPPATPAAPSPPTGIQLIIAEASPTANATLTIKWQPVKTRADGSVLNAVKYSIVLDGKSVGTVSGTSSVRTIPAGQCLTSANRYSVVAVDSAGRRSAMPESIPMPRTVCSPADNPCVTPA